MKWLVAVALLGLPALGAANERSDELWQAYARKAGAYPLETRYLDDNRRPRFINALILESSPYLLQHAHNPIAWNAWSDPVLASARTRNRLIFVSVGYSTCHWCRVMARESFDNPRIADLLNADFVSIKVDREERPDLDEFFLTRLEALSASPGWPMTLVLTPEGELFSAESYMTEPALSAHLQRLARAWKERPEQVRRLATTVAARLNATSAPPPRGFNARAAYDQALAEIRQSYDDQHGGFGHAAKFPDGPRLAFLLGAHARRGDPADRAKFIESLRAIALSALQDPVDGGFFRYSLTRDWQTPHFEKMLHDQATLVRLFAYAWKMTSDPLFSRVAAATIEFVNTRLRGVDGLYAAAMDAESEGSAGADYLWRADVIAESLSAADRKLVEANFRSVAQPDGAMLLLPRPGAASTALATARAALAAARKARPVPAVDAKAVTAWNAMMIEALARAGVILAEPRYVSDAARAMRRLLALHAAGPVVGRYSIDGKLHGAAAEEDFATLLGALAALHDADAASEWHDHARGLLPKFADSGASRPEQLLLFSRDRDTPAATAVLIEALDALYLQTGDARFQKALAGIRPVAAGALASGGGTARASLAAALLDGRAPPLPGAPVRAILAEGHVRAELARVEDDRARTDTQLQLTLTLDAGWHVNSHVPLQDYLIPVAVATAGTHSLAAAYPPGKIVRLGSDNTELSVYEHRVSIGVEIVGKPEGASLPMLLTVQACTEKECLPPETVELNAAAATAERPAAGRAQAVER